MTEIEQRKTLVELEEETSEGQREMAAARAEVRVSHLLKKAFRVTGISQKELAEMLDVTEGRVSQVLNSEGNLRISTAARYLRAMGYILEIEAEPASAGTPSLKIVGRRSRRKQSHPVYSNAGSSAPNPAIIVMQSGSAEGLNFEDFTKIGEAEVVSRNTMHFRRHYQYSISPEGNVGTKDTSAIED